MSEIVHRWMSDLGWPRRKGINTISSSCSTPKPNPVAAADGGRAAGSLASPVGLLFQILKQINSSDMECSETTLSLLLDNLYS